MNALHSIRVGWLSVLIRWGVGGLFVYAGALKALNPAQFVTDIESFRLVPYGVAVVTSLYLPWLEVFCGVALMVGRFRLGAAGILLGLSAIFTMFIVSAWCRGLDISCGCFGSHSGKVAYPWLMGRDVGIMAGLGIVLWLEARKERLLSRDAGRETESDLLAEMAINRSSVLDA